MRTSRLSVALLLACSLIALAADVKEDLVPKDARLEKVAGGCKFTEGPAADAEGNLFFTDSPSNRIMVLRPGGKLEVWSDDSRDANGMRFEVVACAGGFRCRVRRDRGHG